MGVEISSIAPFETRDASDKCLYKNLTKDIKEALKPVHERGVSSFKCSRFWIQADQLDHQVIETNNMCKILFGDVKMSLRTHPMFTDSDGQLKDTENESNKNEPETFFCNDVTKNYDQIGNYFQEFLRLKELTKLQYMGIFLKGFKDSILENEFQFDTEEIDKFVRENNSKKRETLREVL
ncbi:unnamed protein product [Brachionus calyciflorus]|uniref:Uncharacterized protein n=1 Tax=Brachionus calyciflorus TaxID=104777 RepID=A0A814K9V6_9BILA|nr:unnamed protein product [Brachionus calyciflorus]